MHFQNSPDFKTVWQLAHNWVNADPDKTNANAISPELRIAIHRLMHAMACREISVRSKWGRIFEDDSFFSSIFDFLHYLKFFQCLKSNKFDKAYLDSLYVKRNEVINWCINVAFLDLPPCWSHKKLITDTISEAVDPDDENNSWYDKITERRRQRLVCIELAKQLWQLYPGMSYEEMHKHPTMEQLGYSSTFSFKSFKKLVRLVASAPAQLPGAPEKSKN